MMFAALPPVGTRIRAEGGGQLPEFPGFGSFYTQSGTAALAQALISAKELVGEKRKLSVILPAYGCPDLIAATIYAGLRPVLIDIQPNDPGYNLDAIAKALSSGQVCAVVVVNFLGIKDNLSELKRLSCAAGALLVEDNAQWFPEDYLNQQGVADFVLTSFGRGKPLNLLGGGLLLVRSEHESRLQGLESLLALQEGRLTSPTKAFQTKSAIFNVMLSPWVFGIVSKLPFLGVGSTVYHGLDSVEPCSSDALACLPGNLKAYLGGKRWREEKLKSGLTLKTGVWDLTYPLERVGRLLRYPILLSQDKREKLLASSLGASALYRRPLLEVSGVSKALASVDALKQESAPGANEFASRLCTLPLHQGVTEKHLGKLLNCI